MHWRNSDFKIYQVKKVVCENASSLHPEGSANRLHSNPTRLRNQQRHVGPGEGDALPPLAPPPHCRGVVVWYPRSRPTRAQSSEAWRLGCQCPYASLAAAPRVERRENCRRFQSVFVSRRVHTSSDARADSNYFPGSKAVGSPPCRGGTRAVAQPSLPPRHGSAGPPGSCGSGPPPGLRPRGLRTTGPGRPRVGP